MVCDHQVPSRAMGLKEGPRSESPLETLPSHNITPTSDVIDTFSLGYDLTRIKI